MVRAFVLFGGLLVLALIGALVAPYFIDWTAYRDDFQREASAILGRDVVVRGEASARLLPFPSVTVGDVEVLDESGAALATIGRFRMDAELAPYLSGEIFIYSMSLDRPAIRIPIRPDGSIDWVVEKPKIPTGATVVLDNVAITNGTVRIENGLTGRSHELSGVEAVLSAGSLAGPLDGSGRFQLGGEAVAFTLAAGTRQADGSVPVRFVTANETLATQISLDGSARFVEGRPQFAGNAILRRPLPGAATEGVAMVDGNPFAAAGDASPDTAATAASEPDVLPIRAVGAVTLTPTAAEVLDLRVQAGGSKQPYLLTGQGRLDFKAVPHFALDLEGEQVDVDMIASGGAGTGEAGAATAAIGFAERLEAVRAVLADIPRPTIPGTVVISLPVVVAGDTTIRDVAFSASPTDSGWSLARFAAELPGRTRLEASGVVELDENFGFRGDLLVASRQPSGFSDWLTGKIDPSVRALAGAGLAAKTVLTAEQQVFTDLELDIGGDQLTGRLERSKTDGQTTITADLEGGKVDLDALQALSRLFTGPSDALANADQFDVALTAGPVTLRDASAERIDGDIRYDGDTLAIGKLDIEGLAGASLSASGRLSELAGDTRGRLAVSLDSGKPDQFFEFLRSRFPGVPLLDAIGGQAERLAPLALAGAVETIEGEAGKRPSLFVQLDGTANGSKIDLSTSIENGLHARSESGRFGLDLRLENDRPAVLLGQLGLTAMDVGAPAPLETELSLSASATGPIVASATLRAPGSEISLDGTLDIAPKGITGGDVSLYIKSGDALPWLRTGGIEPGASLEAAPLDLTGKIAYEQGDLTIRNLDGQIAGSAIEASLRKRGERPFEGTVRLDTLSMPWLAGLVYGRALDGGEPTKPWPGEAFRPSSLTGVDFSVALTAAKLDLGGPVMTDFAARMSANAGNLTFDDASAATADGRLDGRLMLRNANGIGGLTLEAEASGFDLAKFWPELSVDGETASLDGNIRLDSTGQSYEALVSGLTGAGQVAIANARVPGVPQRVFRPLLAAADREGFKPDAETGATLRGLSGETSFAIPAATSAFSVTAGRARFAPVSIQDGNEELTLDGTVDLTDLTVAADLTLAIDPGDDRVEGAEPTVFYSLTGPLADPTLSVDATALANYLSVRALEREQARVEAMQESLQETLRLRREARFYRWRMAEATRIEQERRVAEEAERLRAEQAAAEAARLLEEQEAARRAAEEEARKAAEETRRREAEEARQREAEEARQREAEAQRQREAADQRRQQQSQPPPAPSASALPRLDFDRPLSSESSDDKTRFPSLPGVHNPLEF
ncbi:AsmA-like C-terminal region-containing protein [Aurantimonas marianensis]|uniref:AsmA family protein n=1 Tax=Aurantimonas marianensis TaxID=2920428 RepID=UPI0021133E97|nr:AsmA-like C-terminal region-containing protein [Aurantimonas marianensis]